MGIIFEYNKDTYVLRWNQHFNELQSPALFPHQTSFKRDQNLKMQGSDIDGLKTFFKIVQKGNLKKLISLGFFLFIGVLIESFGLGLLYPIFKSLMNQENTSFFGIELELISVPFLLGLVGVIYLLKTIYLTILTIQQKKEISL